MARLRLAQLNPEAAADGQVATFNSATGEFEPQNSQGGTFGAGYENDEALAEFTNTLQTYEEANKFTTASLAAGDYRIGVSFEIKTSNANRAVAYRVQIDDTTTVQENIEVMTGDYASFSFASRQTLTAATHDIDIDVRRVAAQAATVSIRNIRVDLWRVS